MRMRSLRVLAVISASAIVPLACTSLLGDYAIGSAGPNDGGSDGGSDGLATQETSGTDGGPDAAGYVTLPCVESGNARFLLGSFPNSNPDRIWAQSRPDGRIRVLAPEGGSKGTHVYTFQPQSGSAPTVTEHLLADQPMAVKSYSGGIVALVRSFVSPDGGDGGGSSQVLRIMKLPDSSETWTLGPTVTAIGDLDCANNRLAATFEVIDAMADNYLVVYSYTPSGPGSCAGNPQIFGRHQMGDSGVAHEWVVPASALPEAGSNGLDFLSSQGIGIDGHDVFVVVNASGGGGGAGPKAGTGPVLYDTTLDMGSAPPSTFPLKDPSDIMFGVAVTSAPEPGKINLGFLEANLSSDTAKPEMYVGQIASANVSGLKPSTGLGQTVLGGLGDLVVEKGRSHWENFASPPSENMLAIGPTLKTNVGANFIWWDAQGHVRAQQTGATGNLLRSEFLYGVEAVFTGPPAAQLAELELLFTKASADAGPNVVDVWATTVSCLKL
jgi:hypothetical protein